MDPVLHRDTHRHVLDCFHPSTVVHVKATLLFKKWDEHTEYAGVANALADVEIT